MVGSLEFSLFTYAGEAPALQKTKKMKPKHGEVVAWSDTTLNNDHKRVPTTIIAIADDESSFVVALNYHEEGRLWDIDGFPEGATLRKADTIEAGYLLATLMEHDYHITIKDGGVYACCPDYDAIEELSASATRSWLFNQYINALIRHYRAVTWHVHTNR